MPDKEKKKKSSDTRRLFGVFLSFRWGSQKKVRIVTGFYLLYSEHVCSAEEEENTTKVSTSVVNVAMHARAVGQGDPAFPAFQRSNQEPCVRVILRLSINEGREGLSDRDPLQGWEEEVPL